MAATSGVRVLIVDVHRMFAESLGRILSDQPALSVIGIATSGHEALERFEDGAPDVVLMDYANDDLVMRAIVAGCSGLITKDQTPDEVARAIVAAHGDEPLFSPAVLTRVLAQMGTPNRRTGWDISPREKEVLDLLAQGVATPEIADNLLVSIHTVRTHVQAIIKKLGAHSRLEAVTIAAREGLVKLT
jgi:two-component system response regulator DevR